MSIAELVREARERKGWSQTRLAEEIGITQYSVSQIETGATKAPTNSWRKLASALEIPESEFAGLMREAQREGRRERGAPSVRSTGNPAVPFAVTTPGKIPVLGRVAGSPMGGGHIIMSEVVDKTDCPPWLDEVPGAYALFVTGESMIPRFYPGEMVFIHPGRQPSRGDFVVVQVQPDNSGEVYGMVKQFMGFDKKGLKLRQFHPKEEDLAPIPMDTVHAIHRVVSTRMT